MLVQVLVQLLHLHSQSMVEKLRKLDESQPTRHSMIQRIFGLLMLLLQAVMVLHLSLRVLPIQHQGKLFVSLIYLVLGLLVTLALRLITSMEWVVVAVLDDVLLILLVAVQHETSLVVLIKTVRMVVLVLGLEVTAQGLMKVSVIVTLALAVL